VGGLLFRTGFAAIGRKRRAMFEALLLTLYPEGNGAFG